jgi:hypothetical protein
MGQRVEGRGQRPEAKPRPASQTGLATPYSPLPTPYSRVTSKSACGSSNPSPGLLRRPPSPPGEGWYFYSSLSPWRGLVLLFIPLPWGEGGLRPALSPAGAGRVRGLNSPQRTLTRPCSLFPTPHTLLPTPHSPHPTPHTLLPTPYSLLPTPHSLHPTPHSLLAH